MEYKKKTNNENTCVNTEIEFMIQNLLVKSFLICFCKRNNLQIVPIQFNFYQQLIWWKSIFICILPINFFISFYQKDRNSTLENKCCTHLCYFLMLCISNKECLVYAGCWHVLHFVLYCVEFTIIWFDWINSLIFFIVYTK